jgi:hypothetical protein
MLGWTGVAAGLMADANATSSATAIVFKPMRSPFRFLSSEYAERSTCSKHSFDR